MGCVMKYKKITKAELFTFMAKRDTDFMLYGLSPFGGVLPVKYIAQSLGTSVYQVRKNMRSLSDEGLVKLNTYNYSDEYDCYPPVKMYSLTQKAREQEEVKELAKICEDEIKKIFEAS